MVALALPSLDDGGNQVSAVRNAVATRNGTAAAVAAGLLAFLAALPVAYAIHLTNRAFAGQPDKAVLVVGGMSGALLVLPSAVYLLVRRRSANPAELGLLVLASAAVLLVAVYLYQVVSFVLFPADILIWSESDFVNDILKLRLGYPLYSAQSNNESFIYTPGSQLLTYFLAWLAGRATSIPAYRALQVGYTLLAAAVALLCWHKLVRISLPAANLPYRTLWFVVCYPILLLIATNAKTNPFVHNLHNDALAQLVSISAYGLLLFYVTTRSRRILGLMAVVPAIGFFVKQSLAVWAVLYCLQLMLFDQPRSFKRLAIFGLVACGGVLAVVAGCYAIWGSDFLYWVFAAAGKHGVSPLRAFQHVLDTWPYLAIGLVGGLILVRGREFRRLLGPWLIWLLLILTEEYTSGIAWMLNHIGPGCLIAGVWFLAGLAKVWPLAAHAVAGAPWPRGWLRTSMLVGLICLTLGGLGLVRIPLPPLSDDAYRYVAAIEKEFAGQSADQVLLDMGTWVYARDNVIMKDRAASIGDRGYGQTGDFSGILSRLEQKRYVKILVRSLNSPDFFYDYYLWRKPSGIRQALLQNYHEVGRIPRVSGESYQYDNYFFGEISILVPNAD
jgi:hypothetical protein